MKSKRIENANQSRYIQVFLSYLNTGGMKATPEGREEHVEDEHVGFRKTWKRKGLGNNILKTETSGKYSSEMAALFETGKAQEEEFEH